MALIRYQLFEGSANEIIIFSGPIGRFYFFPKSSGIPKDSYLVFDKKTFSKRDILVRFSRFYEESIVWPCRTKHTRTD